MSLVRNKLAAFFCLELLCLSFLAVSLMVLNGPWRSAHAQGGTIVVDYATVVSQAPPAYGTNVWWTDQDADTWIERWEELGLSMARVVIPHALIEPANDNDAPTVTDLDGFLLETPIGLPGEITRTITYRAWFEALRDQPSMEVMLSVTYLAPWLTDNAAHPDLAFSAAPYPPNDMAEYKEFVETVLRYLIVDLEFPAERLLFEATNEPDLGCGQDPAVPCFWQNRAMQDVADVVRVTHEAVEEVDAGIRVLGLAECCGTGVVRGLLEYYSEGSYLEGLSYHYYSPSGYNLEEVLNREATLASYGLPIYLDEYGSFQYLSEGVDGALWHSWALPVLWAAGLAPLQFSISEGPLDLEPYNSMGLMEDWTGDWEFKPAFWVYANFFHHMGHADVVSNTAPANLDVMAGRKIVEGEVWLTIWITNRENLNRNEMSVQVHGFPTATATLSVYDNLRGVDALETLSLSGSPLTFTVDIPARSSWSLVLNEQWLIEKIYLPAILKRWNQ
jgi:hypothetical protein